jgi:hypothetical protein
VAALGVGLARGLGNGSDGPLAMPVHEPYSLDCGLGLPIFLGGQLSSQPGRPAGPAAADMAKRCVAAGLDPVRHARPAAAPRALTRTALHSRACPLLLACCST